LYPHQCRTKRTVTLTEAGQVFFQESQKILLQLDRAIQLAQQTNRGELREMTTNQQLQQLRQGEIDIGFIRPPVDEGINSEIVFRETLIVALPQTHPMADRAQVELRQLSTCLLYTSPSPRDV
jgi:DNA-binding transcriptional LysR family regulator